MNPQSFIKYEFVTSISISKLWINQLNANDCQQLLGAHNANNDFAYGTHEDKSQSPDKDKLQIQCDEFGLTMLTRTSSAWTLS